MTWQRFLIAKNDATNSLRHMCHLILWPLKLIFIMIYLRLSVPLCMHFLLLSTVITDPTSKRSCRLPYTNPVLLVGQQTCSFSDLNSVSIKDHLISSQHYDHVHHAKLFDRNIHTSLMPAMPWRLRNICSSVTARLHCTFHYSTLLDFS